MLKKRKLFREKSGAINIDQDYGIIKNINDIPVHQLIEESLSRTLISESMILMGYIIADYAFKHDLAIPYRSQYPSLIPQNYDFDNNNIINEYHD